MFKRFLIFLLLFVGIISLSVVSVNCEEITDIESSINSLLNSLSEEVQADMEYINATSTDLSVLSEVSFESIVSLIVDKLSQNSPAAFASAGIVIAVLVLNSVFISYTDALRQTGMREIVSVVSTLCVTTTLVIPVISLINSSVATITDAADFMLLYIPVMVGIITLSGQAVSGASYYSLMVLACEAVSQLSTKFISPLLSVYLGFCVSSSITDRVNLSGLCQMFSKLIKWLISFFMTIFSALMTIRGMITTAYDSVTARAVRFTMSSFIPIVGAALSESYKTIQGSINLLRTGAGVFVILAIFVVFLPTIAKCLVWILSLNICKSVGELMGETTVVSMLSSVSSVVSTVFAISICIMAVFVISTALLITLGGGAQ